MLPEECDVIQDASSLTPVGGSLDARRGLPRLVSPTHIQQRVTSRRLFRCIPKNLADLKRVLGPVHSDTHASYNDVMKAYVAARAMSPHRRKGLDRSAALTGSRGSI
jgi:hypothetical protein